ncbi:MAG: ADP-heptose synthase [Bdellovibrionales bacterium GWB1_52_6]|nr:MAG: ADP-heptose synthase [Bdellovibrionales bacterium GWB1_52_6]OFZ04923.1 MAG: ADP-heptose synthase [Bdellovibrionales bacterium GWA1_52_35]HCM38859.1 D-glycero-beta-D-manno-heptose 1-phosphate adenylyltransferase [Bdellovibrionales bacterium]
MTTRPRRLSTKIKTPAALRKLLKTFQKKRQRVVFTNGCFDILHRGHVTYLEEARKLADILVVALNDDESVKRLKGDERPINRLAERLEVTAALESVDFVTWFEDDTPLALILKLHPDMLVKGGDWKPQQIVGAAEVVAWGGKVRSLPYLEGHSTTRIIEKTRKKPRG